jgi:hypothetical protein
MSRFLLAAVAVGFAAPVLAAAPISQEGAKGVVFPFPAKAPVVVCLNGYDKARDKLHKLLTAAVPKDAPEIRKLLDEQLDKMFEGRKLSAVRKNARAFLVLNDLTSLVEGSPALSVLVPITKYKDFEESFLTADERRSIDRGQEGVVALKTAAFGEEQPAFLVDLKDYVAITLHKATADSYVARYTPGSTDAMGAELGETFIKADLAIYVNMDAINDEFGEQIRAFKGLIDFALMQAQQQGAFGELSKKQFEAVKVMLKGLVQGIEDCQAVVMAAEFRPEGLLVRLQARFAENSESAKFLASEKPGPLADLGKLPVGLGTYTASQFGKTIHELMRELSQEFTTTNDDERGAALIEEHLRDLAAAGPGAEFSATAEAGVSITVTQYRQPDKAARALAKVYKAVAAGGRVGGVVVKTAPHVTDEAEKHGDFTFSHIRLNHDYEATVAGLPEGVREATLEMLKRMTPEKGAHWVGTDGKVVVRLSAKNFEAAKVLLDGYFQGKGKLGDHAAFKKVREQLPTEANMIFVAEIEAAITQLVMGMKAGADAIPGFPRLGPLKKIEGGKNAYIGFAITLKSDVATVTGFLPATSIDVARRLLDSVFKAFD